MRDLLLLLETSGPKTLVGLAQATPDGWQMVAEAPSRASSVLAGQPEMQHTALLLPLVKQVLAQAPPTATTAPSTAADGHHDLREQPFLRLAAIAVSSGPGSYTALRAGLSSAKGLCLALDIPLLKCNTLRGLAHAAAAKTTPQAAASTLVLIHARRDEFYCGLFAPDGKAHGEVNVVTCTEAWAKSLHMLNISTICSPTLEAVEDFCMPLTSFQNRGINWVEAPLQPANLLTECKIRIAEMIFDDVTAVTPDYIRAPFITEARTRL